MNKKHMEFYFACMESGELPDDGLCRCKAVDQIRLAIFEPTLSEKDTLRAERKPVGYWANGEAFLHQTMGEMTRGFTPLRQTIVLFMAALNDDEIG